MVFFSYLQYLNYTGQIFDTFFLDSNANLHINFSTVAIVTVGILFIYSGLSFYLLSRHRNKWPKGLVNGAIISLAGLIIGTLGPLNQYPIAMLSTAIACIFFAHVILKKQLFNPLAELNSKLAENEERMRLQFNGVPVPTYIWQSVDDDFKLIDHNDAASEITHGKIHEMLGIGARQFYADAPFVREELTRCYKQQKTFETEATYKYRTTGEEKLLAVKYGYLPPNMIIVHTMMLLKREN